MISVLSATEHDFYAMPLPFAVYSWKKIGVNCIVFIPKGNNPKIDLAIKYCPSASFFYFECEEKRIPTFSQVIRLFAAAIPILKYDEELITADSDVCVFKELLDVFPAFSSIDILGADLTPKDQYPMCFIKMDVMTWKYVFNINKTYQEHVAELINPIEGLNIRGEQWCYDQWFAKKKIDESNEDIELINRSNGLNQFAQKRADRDSWNNYNPYDIIDAHLPRPLTDASKFNMVYDLFKIKYPNDDLQWMVEYCEQYKALLLQQNIETEFIKTFLTKK